MFLDAAASATALLNSLIGGGKSNSPWSGNDVVDSIVGSINEGCTESNLPAVDASLCSAVNGVWSSYDDKTLWDPTPDAVPTTVKSDSTKSWKRKNK